jgi:hypothetical protein
MNLQQQQQRESSQGERSSGEGGSARGHLSVILSTIKLTQVACQEYLLEIENNQRTKPSWQRMNKQQQQQQREPPHEERGEYD